MNEVNQTFISAAIVVVIVGGILIFTDYSRQQKPWAEEPSADSPIQFKDFSHNLRQLAYAKEMCDYFDHPQDFVLCTSMPFSYSSSVATTDKELDKANETLIDFLAEHVPPAKAACRQNRLCTNLLTLQADEQRRKTTFTPPIQTGW